MNTLKELVINTKCRKGPSVGTTKRGAFWLACEEIQIRSFGGDGIGQSCSDCTNYLQLRHFRSGEVRATVKLHSWHQNSGAENTYIDASSILDCQSVEDIIVILKGLSNEDTGTLYSDHNKEGLEKALDALGMIAALPAPDA